MKACDCDLTGAGGVLVLPMASGRRSSPLRCSVSSGRYHLLLVQRSQIRSRNIFITLVGIHLSELDARRAGPGIVDRHRHSHSPVYLIALPKSLFGSATTTNEPCPQPQHREDWSAAACSYSSAPSRHSLREASLTAFGKPASGFSETRNLPCCSFTRRLGVLLIRAYPRSSLVLCLQRLGKRLELEIMELLVRHVCVCLYIGRVRDRIRNSRISVQL